MTRKLHYLINMDTMNRESDTCSKREAEILLRDARKRKPGALFMTSWQWDTPDGHIELGKVKHESPLYRRSANA